MNSEQFRLFVVCSLITVINFLLFCACVLALWRVLKAAARDAYSSPRRRLLALDDGGSGRSPSRMMAVVAAFRPFTTQKALLTMLTLSAAREFDHAVLGHSRFVFSPPVNGASRWCSHAHTGWISLSACRSAIFASANFLIPTLYARNTTQTEVNPKCQDLACRELVLEESRVTQRVPGREQCNRCFAQLRRGSSTVASIANILAARQVTRSTQCRCTPNLRVKCPTFLRSPALPFIRRP